MMVNELQNIPGILVQLDFCKGFDTIEGSFIKRSLALFNFGDSIQQWVSTFHNNSESAVLNNGFCTNFANFAIRSIELSRFLISLEIYLALSETRQKPKRFG